MQRLDPERIRVAGGAAIVSNTVLAQLTPIAADTKRVSGPDRYATAAAINTDALRHRNPGLRGERAQLPRRARGRRICRQAWRRRLYLSAPQCLPAPAATDLLRLGVARVTFFGLDGGAVEQRLGTASLLSDGRGVRVTTAERGIRSRRCRLLGSVPPRRRAPAR